MTTLSLENMIKIDQSAPLVDFGSELFDHSLVVGKVSGRLAADLIS